MKHIELRKLIREEVRKVLNESPDSELKSLNLKSGIFKVVFITDKSKWNNSQTYFEGGVLSMLRAKGKIKSYSYVKMESRGNKEYLLYTVESNVSKDELEKLFKSDQTAGDRISVY